MPLAYSQPLLELAPGAVHLWLAACEEHSEEQLRAVCGPILNSAESQQAQTFHFAVDRSQYQLTRALVRTVLSCYAPLAPQDWQFETNGYGRPEIANPQLRTSGLSFNLSHTRGLIALGVAKDGALGVDVENVAARAGSLEIARRWFSAEETAALAALPPHQQQSRFFEYWTLKEAYVKARGMGLSLPLDKFSFHYPDEGEVALSISSELSDDPLRWQLWQLQPTAQHVVAVCAARNVTRPSALTVRWAQPGLAVARALAGPTGAAQRNIIRRLSSRNHRPRVEVHS